MQQAVKVYFFEKISEGWKGYFGAGIKPATLLIFIIRDLIMGYRFLLLPV